jgi:hypothetical protein
LESSSASITVVGKFAPEEALPQYLADVGVLSDVEARSAVFKSLVPGQIVEFLLNWGLIQAVEQRLVLQTSNVPYVRIADATLKILREAQRKAVVTMFGINREYTYRYSSMEARDALGVAIAPPSAWGPWGRAIEGTLAETIHSPAKHGGLITATMRQANMEDREAGWIDVSVSAGSGNDETGWAVLVRVNDHFQYSEKFDPPQLSGDDHKASRTSRLLDSLVENFDLSVQRADEIVSGLIDQ